MQFSSMFSNFVHKFLKGALQDPLEGYVATVTCIQLLLHVYLCRGGDPPADKLPMFAGTRVFGVRLFPNSFGLIPELVYLSSEVAWLIPEPISPF